MFGQTCVAFKKANLLFFSIALLLIWAAPALAIDPTYIIINFTPDKPAVNQVINLDIRAYVKEPDGQQRRLRRGRLVVSITDKQTNRRIKTYTAAPDGQTDIFVINWLPQKAGRYELTASFSGSVTASGARASKEIIVFQTPPPTTAARVETTTTTTTTTAPTTTTLSPVTTTLPPAPTTVPTVRQTTTTYRPTTTTVPSTTTTTTTTTTAAPPPTKNQLRGNVETLLTIAVDHKSGREYLITVKVRTLDGNLVEEGDVVVTVSGGQLSPGQGNQALLPAALVENRLIWTAPRGSGRNYKLTAEYYGARFEKAVFLPAAASIRLPPQ